MSIDVVVDRSIGPLTAQAHERLARSELKRRQKAERLERERAEKMAAKFAEMAEAGDSQAAAAAPEDISPQQYFANRIRQLAEYEQSGGVTRTLARADSPFLLAVVVLTRLAAGLCGCTSCRSAQVRRIAHARGVRA